MKFQLQPAYQAILRGYLFTAALCSSFYVLLFGYSWPSIGVHLFLVLTYSGCLLAACVNLASIIASPTARNALLAGLFILFNLVLATTYSANFISSFFWSAPMYDSALLRSLGLLVEYYVVFFSKLNEIPTLIGNENWGFLVKSLVAGIPLILVQLVLCVYLALRTVRRLATAHIPRYRVQHLAWLLVILGISYPLTQVAKNTYSSQNWRGEVIIDSLLMKGSYAYPDAYRDREAKKNRAAFETYSPGTGNRKNIIIIMLDAFRGNFIYDPEHPPRFLSRLMQDGRLQRIDAFSICPNTTCGIMGLLSSKDVTRIHNNSVMVQEAFTKAGYSTYVINAGLPEWYRLEEIYKQTFQHYFDTNTTAQPAMSDDIFLHVMPQLELGSQQPFFMFLRMMSTHEYGRLNSNDWVSRYEYATRVYQADEYLEKMFAVLQQKGVLDNSIVIITGDHGESLGEKDERGHNISLYHNQIHVPILIYDPEHRHYPARTLASSLDIAPTLLDRAGLAIPAFMEGQSLLQAGPEERWLFHAKVDVQYQNKIRAVTYIKGDKIYKFIHTGARRYSLQEHKEELFELTSDPEENHNLIADGDPTLLARMRQQFDQHFHD